MPPASKRQSIRNAQSQQCNWSEVSLSRIVTFALKIESTANAMNWPEAMLGEHPPISMIACLYHNILACVNFFFHMLWIQALISDHQKYRRHEKGSTRRN
jgi:hypothetical protein